MTIDFDDDYEDFDDDGDLADDKHHEDVEDLDDEAHDDDEHHDDVEDLADETHDDDTQHHDDEEYVPPAPRRSTNPRSLSAKHRSGGLWPCGVPHCACKAYDGTEGTGYSCACGHLYQIHLHGFG